MKKITIILVAIVLVITVGAFACNSAKGFSTNNEGLTHLPSAATVESLLRR